MMNGLMVFCLWNSFDLPLPCFRLRYIIFTYLVSFIVFIPGNGIACCKFVSII